MKKNKAIITAVSNKFFPSVLNLINSIRANYDENIDIFVYDLGLSYTFRKELEHVKSVYVINMPQFCPHWRSCYTWKTYIFTKPLAMYNLYLDAGCQIGGALDATFAAIQKNGYFVIDQGVSLSDIVPIEYKRLFQINNKFYNESCVDAGVFGFDSSEEVNEVAMCTYDAAVAGLSLGFSKRDAWRNKDKDKNIFVRGCVQFRHDLTLLNIFLRKKIGDLDVSTANNILKIRMNYRRLRYVNDKMTYTRNISVTKWINRLVLNSFIVLRGCSLKLRGKKDVPYMDLK